VKYTGRDRLNRPGLMHVRSISSASLQAIDVERVQAGPFLDLVDFTERSAGRVHKAHMERLILVGTFSLVAEQVRAVDWSPNVVDLELASKRLAASFGHGDEYADVNVNVGVAA